MIDFIHVYSFLPLLYFLKVCLRVFADRTDEIIGKFLANPLVAANSATPYGLTLRSCANCLGLWLNIILIKLIGAG